MKILLFYVYKDIYKRKSQVFANDLRITIKADFEVFNPFFALDWKFALDGPIFMSDLYSATQNT